jgi:UPF0755 protein
MNGRQTIIDMIGNVAKWVLIVVLILFFVKQANRFYQIGYSVFSPTSMDASGSGKEVTVDITKDMSVRDIGKLLQKDELIANGTVFYYQEMFSAYHGKIQPGEYTLRSDMLPEEMLEVMSGGQIPLPRVFRQEMRRVQEARLPVYRSSIMMPC